LLKLGISLVSFLAMVIGMPIGNWVGSRVKASTLKTGIAILLVILGIYSLVNFTIKEEKESTAAAAVNTTL
jgi:uncharacterized membrane protein YfcA